MEKLILKILLGLFFAVILFQVYSVYADEHDEEELPQITITFVTGDVIDLNKDTLVRADVEIADYDPHHGYYYMQVIRIHDREVLKEGLIFPKIVDDNLYGVQILHYIEEPDVNSEDLIGKYVLRIYSQYGSSEAWGPFSIVKPNISIAIPNTVKELEPESRIPSWVHDIFVWYAEETISEEELLRALEYLISEDIINVNSN